MTTTLINTENFIVETIKHATDLENPKAEVIRLINESSNTEETYSYCYKEYKCLFLNSPRYKITCVFSTSEKTSPTRKITSGLKRRNADSHTLKEECPRSPRNAPEAPARTIWNGTVARTWELWSNVHTVHPRKMHDVL